MSSNPAMNSGTKAGSARIGSTAASTPRSGISIRSGPPGRRGAGVADHEDPGARPHVGHPVGGRVVGEAEFLQRLLRLAADVVVGVAELAVSWQLDDFERSHSSLSANTLAALAASALLGAPLGHDHVYLSLSDLHTPWDLEELRAKYAAPGEKLVLLAGRLVYEKGFQVALEALPHVIRRVGKVRFR
mgnify:CR=1 FL=1